MLVILFASFSLFAMNERYLLSITQSGMYTYKSFDCIRNRATFGPFISCICQLCLLVTFISFCINLSLKQSQFQLVNLLVRSCVEINLMQLLGGTFKH